MRYKTDIELILEKAIRSDAELIMSGFIAPFSPRNRYGYIFDMAFPTQKIAIECDGEHFHPVGNKHDVCRDAYFRKRGWIILRFRGKQIKNNTSLCVDKIKQEMRKCIK